MKRKLSVPIWILGASSLLKGNILPQRSSHKVLNADTGLFTKPRPLLHWHIELSDSRSCFFPANQELASVKGNSFQPSSPYHEGSTEVTGQPVTGRGPPSVWTQWNLRDLSCLKTVFNLPLHRAKGCFETILLLCHYCWVFFCLAYRETGDRFLVLILITSVRKRFLLTAEYFWIWWK